MGVWSRFFGSRDDVPRWACFFAPREYKAFLEAVQSELKRRGKKGRVEDGILVLDGDAESRYGLSNLAQLCHANRPFEWSSTITEHFDNLEASDREGGDLERRIGDFDSVRSLLKIRLYPPDYLDQLGRSGLVFREPAMGVVAALVYDLPSSIRNVLPEHALRWGVDEDELFRVGLKNISVEESPVIEDKNLPEGGEFRILVGDSFFTASRLLLLENYIDSPTPYGVVVSVPHRHVVLFHPILDIGVVKAISAMLPVAFGMYQEGPGSISPNLYWFRKGEFMLLPSKVTAKKITFLPPETFVTEVLNTFGES